MFLVSQLFVSYHHINSLQRIVTLLLSLTLLGTIVSSEPNTGKVGKYVFITYEFPMHGDLIISIF